MRVLVLDPGERVGWCSAVVREGGMRVNTAKGSSAEKGDACRLDVTGHGIAYLKDMALAVHQAVAVEKRYDVVVFEKWALTAKGARVSVGSEMDSCQFVGMLRLACWLGGTKIVKQPPSMQSPNGTAERALKCGHPSAAGVQAIIDSLPAAHDESHDRSALLHLWGYFFKEYV